MTNCLPASILDILNTASTPAVMLAALMPAVGAYLACDRCFLYLREPSTSLGKVPFCWVRSDDIPLLADEGWQLDPDWLPDRDPMFAAALRAEPSIIVEDVETASPTTLNRQFERESFGHRALIHAHICQAGQLWGVLQPSVFGHPRQWTSLEQSVVAQVVQAITPSVIAYVMANQPAGEVPN
jgi:GAF domain-containing protein